MDQEGREAEGQVRLRESRLGQELGSGSAEPGLGLEEMAWQLWELWRAPYV